MLDLEHWGFVLSNQVDKKTFIHTILTDNTTPELQIYKGKKGVLFSDIAIDAYIKKEYYEDDLKSSLLQQDRKLRTFSSGERKKVYLEYCINQSPDFIIVDNPLDHLDIKSRELIAIQLEEISKKIALIIIVNRQVDLFPFVSNKAIIKDDSFAFHPFKIEIENLQAHAAPTIPPPLDSVELATDTLIKMTDLNVSYFEKSILKNINWTIKKGDFWHLHGPNGSGKSTLLSLITGENTKGYGQDLQLFGIQKGSGETIWDIKKNIGYFSTAMTDLFQKNDSLENMVLSGFFDSIGLYVQPTQLQKKRVAEWLSLVAMTEYKNKLFRNLSVGQQRIALIVRAVLKHPPLLILDEALEGLDDQNVALVSELISLLSTQTDIAILYVSHRKEPSIQPKYFIELIPSPEGSTATINLN
jgi:molybdate transport system ATP-binding protein